MLRSSNQGGAVRGTPVRSHTCKLLDNSRGTDSRLEGSTVPPQTFSCNFPPLGGHGMPSLSGRRRLSPIGRRRRRGRSGPLSTGERPERSPLVADSMGVSDGPSLRHEIPGHLRAR